jgi:hypothetical protein
VPTWKSFPDAGLLAAFLTCVMKEKAARFPGSSSLRKLPAGVYFAFAKVLLAGWHPRRKRFNLSLHGRFVLIVSSVKVLLSAITISRCSPTVWLAGFL